MVGVFFCGVELCVLGFGGSVQFVQIGDRLEVQFCFEFVFDKVLGVFYLVSYLCGIGFVNDDVDVQCMVKVFGYG